MQRRAFILGTASVLTAALLSRSSATHSYSGLPSYENAGQIDPAKFGPGAAYATVRDIATQFAPALATETNRLTVALLLRDLVYWRCKMEPSPSFRVPWEQVDIVFRDCIRDRLYGHQCGGRMQLYQIACRAFGIATRYIALFEKVTDIDPQTTFVHATSDVLIANRWIALDAHYNTSLRDDCGWRISWIEARQRLQDGRQVVISNDGYAQDPLITPEHYLDQVYHLTMKDLTRYVAIGKHWDGRQIVSSSSAVPGWDGTLTYLNGVSPTINIVTDSNSGFNAQLASDWT